MADIPISEALLLWNLEKRDGETAFVVRPLGHPDYDNYHSKVGACFRSWHENDTDWQKRQLLIEIWHAAAFYHVPIAMIHEACLVIPEYRDMLADDCLPKGFQHERA